MDAGVQATLRKRIVRVSVPFLAALSLFTTGCGESTELDFSEALTVAMIATFDAPPGATGSDEPKFQNYTFTGLTMTPAADDEGVVGEEIDLFTLAEAEETELRIITRSQIIFEADVADYVDSSFTAINVVFSDAVTGSGPGQDDLAFTLSEPTMTHTEAITFEKAKSKRLTISVQWKNTITVDEDAGTETMTEPSYSTALTDE